MDQKITEDNINDINGLTVEPTQSEPTPTEQPVQEVQTPQTEPVTEPQSEPTPPQTEPVPQPVQAGQEVSINDKMAQLDAAIAQAQKVAKDYADKITALSSNENFFKSNATAEDKKDFETKKQTIERKLAAQPKVTILVPLQGQEKVGTILPVTINGFVTEVPKGQYVEVPQQIGEIIKESLNQTIAAENSNPFNLATADPEKKKALNA